MELRPTSSGVTPLTLSEDFPLCPRLDGKTEEALTQITRKLYVLLVCEALSQKGDDK